MEIVLKNSLILVSTNFDTLNAKWMRDFLNEHTRGMLFLQKSVLVFRNDLLIGARQEFLHQLSEHHASRYDFSHNFFLRSLLKFGNYPIKIELNKKEEPQNVNVNLYAYDRDTVLITLEYPNSWVMSYLRSQLNVYIERGTDTTLVLDVSDYKAKERLEKTLNKQHVLHYNLTYKYNNHFLSKLYSYFSSFSFGNLYKDEDDEEKNRFYSILECPLEASQDDIKNSYKKLAKIYHPDKMISEKPYMIKYYTRKFQLIHEAYSALRVVS